MDVPYFPHLHLLTKVKIRGFGFLGRINILDYHFIDAKKYSSGL